MGNHRSGDHREGLRRGAGAMCHGAWRGDCQGSVYLRPGEMIPLGEASLTLKCDARSAHW